MICAICKLLIPNGLEVRWKEMFFHEKCFSKRQQIVKEKNVYRVKSTTPNGTSIYIKAYSGAQAKFIANKVLFHQDWINATEVSEIPETCFYLNENFDIRQKPWEYEKTSVESD